MAIDAPLGFDRVPATYFAASLNSMTATPGPILYEEQGISWDTGGPRLDLRAHLGAAINRKLKAVSARGLGIGTLSKQFKKLM